MRPPKRKYGRALHSLVPIIVALAMVSTFAACSGGTTAPAEYLMENKSQLNGCDLGAVCTFPSFCWYDQSLSTGKLDCRADTHTFGTSCMPGNYCDAQTLATCTAPNGSVLVCDVVNHKIGSTTPDAGAGGKGGSASTTTTTTTGAGGTIVTTSDAGAGGKGGATTTITTTTTGGTGGMGGATTNSCKPTDLNVACNVGNYGCLPVNVSYCMDGGNDAGIETILQCLCPNPKDGNKGTWLYTGSNCSAMNLCWQPVQSDGGVGGAGGATTTTTTVVGDAGQPDASSSADAGNDAGDGGSPIVFTGFVANWKPPAGFVLDNGGFVAVWAWYNEADGGLNHPWDDKGPPLCIMQLVNGVYSCELNVVPVGSDLYLDIKYSNAKSPESFCWVFDISPNIPCGGNGVPFGTPTFTFKGAPVVYDLKMNYLKNPMYLNAHINPTP